MRILHVETGKHLYGGALQVLYLMQGLKARSCQNTLVCAVASEIGKAAGEAAAVYEVPMAGELDPGFVLRLGRIIRIEQPDIVHVHSRRGADLWGGIAARLTKTRVVVTRRVDNPEPPRLARAKYRLYDRVVTISEGIRQVLLTEGVVADKVVCVPSAVDISRYENVCEKAWFCREFGIQPCDKVIGLIAQFIARKGHRYLIEAAPGILAHFPETRFLFLGQGHLQKKLQEVSRRTNIADQLRFAGFRTDLERILPCLDLVVHPATMEGLGVCLLQAAASGLPIVATRVGGIPEIVHDGVSGYLVAPGDARALTDAVLSLLQDPGKANRFGQAGREIVRLHFSIEAMVAGNQRVYRQVLLEKAD